VTLATARREHTAIVAAAYRPAVEPPRTDRPSSLRLVDGHRLGEVARHIRVDAAQQRQLVRKQLQW